MSERGEQKIELALSHIGAVIAEAQDHMKKLNEAAIISMIMLTKAQQETERLYELLGEYIADEI